MHILTHPESFYLAEKSLSPCLFRLTRKVSALRKDQLWHALSDISEYSLSGYFSLSCVLLEMLSQKVYRRKPFIDLFAHK